MVRHNLPSFKDGNAHQGEHGNVSRDIFKVLITPEMRAGDIVAIAQRAWDTLYTQITVRVPNGNTPGLTMDLGYELINYDTNEQNVKVLDGFGAGLDVSTEAVTDLLGTTFRMTEEENRCDMHNIVATLDGVVTQDEWFEIVVDRIFIGSN